jgi:DNA polymerase (family 10)
MDLFVKLPRINRVLGKGPTKSSIEFNDGVRAQVWVLPPEEFGTGLVYATGSKDHNVRLREIALAKGLSLSEHFFLKLKGEDKIFCTSEEEVYETLGLPWIPPEMREDRGEIQAAKAGRLPKLIEIKNIKADLQTHSNYSDGKLAMLEMAKAAAKRGIKVIAFTDHSVSLGVTGGLSMERHKVQAAEIKKIQKQLGDKILVLHATEVEIKADGTLDYPDEFLATLDLVVASMHTGLRQPREKVTERTINAIRNPHVDIIGHPTGRLIPDREPADLGRGPCRRRRNRRSPGDQRPPIPPRPGRYLRPPRQRPGHPDHHQHGCTLGSRFRHAALRRCNCPPRLARAWRCDQLLDKR